MDNLEHRYQKLLPNITVFGPNDKTPRPAVVLFHGCGGLRPHTFVYAQALALMKLRVYVIDSFTPRGWDRAFATSRICTGLVMQGYERAGDVLAVMWGLKQSGLVDMSKVVLVGSSHGAWSILDLLTAPLEKSGEVKIKDPDPSLVADIKGVFFLYPYMNLPSRINFHHLLRTPKTFAVLAEKDHLTLLPHSKIIMKKLKDEGVDIDYITVDATHAFDEADNNGPIMFHNDQATQISLDHLLRFCDDLLLAPNQKWFHG